MLSNEPRVRIQIVRANCDRCSVQIELRTVMPLDISPEPDGSAFLRNVHGNPFSCNFCGDPLTGALFRQELRV